jgi:hypothetical protein
LTAGTVDLAELAVIRKNIPALAHRRPELYAEVAGNSAQSL